MKRYLLSSVSIMLLLTLLLPLGCPFAFSEQLPGEEQMLTERQQKLELFILPAVNKDYANKDTNLQFEQIFRDILTLLPADKLDLTLFNSHGRLSFQNVQDPKLIANSISFPYAFENTSDCLKTIEGKPGQIVVALESRNLQQPDTLEANWSELYRLAASGAEVYLIGLETRKNIASARAFASWLSGGLQDSKSFEDRLVQVAPNLYYMRISDYDSCLQALHPLISKLTGYSFEQLNSNEQGGYLLHPYAELTSHSLLLLEGDLTEASLSITGRNGSVTCDTISRTTAMTALTIPNESSALYLFSDAELASLLWAPVYKDAEHISFILENSDGKNAFDRNEIVSFFAAFGHLDPELLLESMELHDDVCELYDVETGETLQVMTYDPQDRVFRTEYAFNSSGSQRILGARIRGTEEEPVICSSPFVVSIANTAPALQAHTEPFYWIGDPWAEGEQSGFSVPLRTEDAEGDPVTLRIVQPATGVIPGLGSVKLSDDQTSLNITLTNEPRTNETFHIQLIGSDGEAESEMLVLSIQLCNLEEELKKLSQAAVITVEPAAELTKHTELTVALQIAFPEDMSPELQEALNAQIQQHFVCEVTLTGSEEGAENQPLDSDENGRWKKVLESTGVYTLQATYLASVDGLQIQASPITLTVAGHTPAQTGFHLPDRDEMLNAEDISSEEFWILDGIVPTQLFTDVDGDEISISVTADRINQKEGEAPVTLQTEASGGTETTLRFTVPGEYLVTIAAHDIDGAGEQLSFKVRVSSTRMQLVCYLLMGIAAAAAALLLVLLLIHLFKPSFRRKAIEMSLVSPDWSHTVVVPCGIWKKKKQPLSVLFTCAFFPPDAMLYTSVDGCAIKPTRHGFALLNADKLGFRKKTNINLNESVSFSSGQYSITMTVIKA